MFNGECVAQRSLTVTLTYANLKFTRSVKYIYTLFPISSTFSSNELCMVLKIKFWSQIQWTRTSSLNYILLIEVRIQQINEVRRRGSLRECKGRVLHFECICLSLQSCLISPHFVLLIEVISREFNNLVFHKRWIKKNAKVLICVIHILGRR